MKKFTQQEVGFSSNGIKIAGILHVPLFIDQPLPALIIGHPGSGVKEQTASLYAQKLTERGYITLTFDAAHQGASEGMPRGLEDPAQRTEDFKSAVSFLHTLALVDASKIGLLGICAGGGYAITAAAADQRVRAVATVIAADINRQFRKGSDGNQDPGVFQTMLNAAAAARTAEAMGEAPATFPLFPATAEEARAMGEHVFEGWEYYCTPRGYHPRSAKFLTWNSIDRIGTFDAFAFIDQISPRPLLMISGSEALTLWMSQEAFAAAKEPKELMVIEGANHMAMYDDPGYLEQAIGRITVFFNQTFADVCA